MFRLALLCTWLAVVVSADAAEPKLTIPEEQAAWSAIAARFAGAPEVKEDKAKTMLLAVAGLKDKPAVGSASVLVNKESGHVEGVTSNAAAFTDDEFKQFAKFPELRSLTLWHNSGAFTGAGLAYVAKLPKLSSITLAGGSLADVGLAELAKMPQLKELRIFHSKFSDAGVALLRGHPALESISMGPQWSSLLTDKSLESLATCPKLQKIQIDQTWLTWEGGLKHLAARKTPLAEANFSNCIIEPADLEKFKAAQPATKVSWKGFGSASEELKKTWLRTTAEKWIPKELLARVIAEGAKSPPPAEKE